MKTDSNPVDSYFFADKETKQKFGPIQMDQILGFVLSIEFPFTNLYVFTSTYGKWLPIQKSPLWIQLKLEQILTVEMTKTFNSVVQQLDHTNSVSNTENNLKTKATQNTKTHSTANSNNDRRKNMRHPCRMEIVFSYDKKVFKTYTVDLSRGGVSLEKNLPDHFLQNEVEVFLNWSEQNVRLKFQARPIVIDQKSHRIEFKGQNEFSKGKLNQLINFIKSGISNKAA